MVCDTIHDIYVTTCSGFSRDDIIINIRFKVSSSDDEHRATLRGESIFHHDHEPFFLFFITIKYS